MIDVYTLCCYSSYYRCYCNIHIVSGKTGYDRQRWTWAFYEPRCFYLVLHPTYRTYQSPQKPTLLELSSPELRTTMGRHFAPAR